MVRFSRFRNPDCNYLPNHEIISPDFSNGNRLFSDEVEDRSASPNSAASSFQMEFGLYGGGGNISSRIDQMKNSVLNEVGESERASSRASDEDENGSTRKKLRLSKDQSAYLEESFKEHNTLNPVRTQRLIS